MGKRWRRHAAGRSLDGAMGETKGNGQDATTIEMVELLRGLRDDVHGMRDDLLKRIDGVESRLGARIEGVESRLGARIDGVEGRLDRLQEDVLALRADQTTMRKELNILRSELRGDLALHEHERQEAMRDVMRRVERLEAAVFKKAV